MAAVVSEMLSRSEEVGFPDLVTVMRNLSSDTGMPALPPGGGLASKYVPSKDLLGNCTLFHSLVKLYVQLCCTFFQNLGL